MQSQVSFYHLVTDLHVLSCKYPVIMNFISMVSVFKDEFLLQAALYLISSQRLQHFNLYLSNTTTSQHNTTGASTKPHFSKSNTISLPSIVINRVHSNLVTYIHGRPTRFSSLGEPWYLHQVRRLPHEDCQLLFSSWLLELPPWAWLKTKTMV